MFIFLSVERDVWSGCMVCNCGKQELMVVCEQHANLATHFTPPPLLHIAMTGMAFV